MSHSNNYLPGFSTIRPDSGSWAGEGGPETLRDSKPLEKGTWLPEDTGVGSRAAVGQGTKPSVKGSHPVPDGQVTPLLKQRGNLETCGQSSSGVTPGTGAASPLSTGFPRQGYWSGLPFPSPGNLLVSPVLSGGTQSPEFKSWS